MSDTNPQSRSGGAEQAGLETNNEPGRDTLFEVNDAQRRFPFEHYQAGGGGGFSVQNSSANGFEFAHGGNASSSSTVHYPDARGPVVANAQSAAMQEQDGFHLPGGNGMFAMPNQRSMPPPSTHGEPSHPPFNHPPFAHAAPTAQDTRFSFNQYMQSLNPAYLDGANGPPLAIQPPPPPPPQPQPQPIPTPALQLPSPFWGHHFQSFAQVTDYVNGVAWYPSMGRYGLPQTDEQYKFYLEKICRALRNINSVWDMNTAPWQFGKFIPGGEWANTKDIEAIAHIVILAAMRIHVFGVTDFAHKRSVDYMSFHSEDIDFTFPQRMYYVACLLHHSKAAAAEVMAKVHIDKYVAAPMTALRSLDQFASSWGKTSPEEKKNMLEVAPYVGSGVTHPSLDVQAQLVAMSMARYRQMYAARQRRDSATGSTVNATGQASGE